MKRFRILLFVLVGFLLFTTVGVLAVNQYFAPKPITIADPTLTLAKAYDGTTQAAIIPGSVTGVANTDDVKINAVATYDSAAIGTAKTITVVYTLEGKDAESYITPGEYKVETGVITAAPLTVADPLLILSKEVDGTTTAAVTPGALIGVVGNEDVTLTAVATYDSADVGTNKTITVNYTLGGVNAANYITPNAFILATGEITAVPVAATSDSSISDSTTYDSTTYDSATYTEPSTNYSAPVSSAPDPTPAALAAPVPDAVTTATP